ncbi:MAG: YggU family protein [Thermoplasmata archaeon]|nr:YggU family protein [Thermoplasmata archaeon]
MDIEDVSRERAGNLEVDVLVSPRSSRSGPEGYDEWRKRLILRVKAPPLDGRANQEVEETFKGITGFKCQVTSGQLNRQKTVTVYGDPARAREALREAADGRRREAGMVRLRNRGPGPAGAHPHPPRGGEERCAGAARAGGGG